MKLTAILPLVLLLAACGSGGGSQDAGVDTALPDAFETDISLPDDVPEPEIPDPGPADVYENSADEGKVDLQGVFPLAVDLTCEGSPDCQTPCGNGSCENGVCLIKPLPGYCVDGQTQTPEEALCYLEGQHSGAHPCLFCNTKVDLNRLVPTVMEESFESFPLKFNPQVQDLTGGGMTWVVSDDRAHWGDASLYFGDPDTKTYDNDLHVGSDAIFQSLTVPDIDHPLLSFFLFLDTEETEGYDVLTVTAITADESFELFNSDSLTGTTQGGFVTVEVGLDDLAGQTVDLAFRFDSVDGGINAYEGAYLDGIRMGSGCCGAEHDCDDGNPCTDDQCPGAGGNCINDYRAGCCVVDSDCSDGDTCTVDGCPQAGGDCLFLPIDGCCHEDGDCDDGDPCSLDSCPVDGGQCLHLPFCCETAKDCVSPEWCLVGDCLDGACEYIDLCCHSDADCADLDPCTVDICEAGDCLHKQANLPGCCWPELLLASFDGGDDGFTMDPPVGGVGWSVTTSGKSASSPGALYYGDPSSKDYDNGNTNQGTAVSPETTLPDGYGAQLSFKVYMDTETGTSYDTLTLYWRETEGDWVVWSKDYGLTQMTFVTVNVDISGLAGRTGELAFFFNTHDATINYGEGVYIDDIALTSTCASVNCEEDSDCNDGLSFTKEACAGGQCQWEFLDVECVQDWDCDDMDYCTWDYCVNGQCIHEWDPWCW